MIEQIRPNLFRITVPLPHSPLKYLNAYVLRGEERNCLIDTGLNRNTCLQALNQGLAELGVDMERTDILVTHIHSDHSGLVPTLYAQGASIWMGGADAEILTQPFDWSKIQDFARINGLPEQELEQAKDSNPGFKFRPRGEVETQELKDGDIVRCGEFQLRCLLTPGHSSGHISFYEPDQGLLFAGDTLLQEITPNISQWLPGENPLHDYLESLSRLHEFDISLVLPGHRRLFSEHRERIEQLQEHHHKRLEEVLTIVRDHPGHAFHIASHMTWDLDTKEWESFPLAQKWFATGEALAHLNFLQSRGEIRKEFDGRHDIWFS
ncbi:MAG: MBL fold metallo-hydrolase [Desulfohalobiaceae bacterium]|nr:MBL fold metallo-hydrolase [Desulfohalobiaceae bacterium]